jgi:hypothetical protein
LKDIYIIEGLDRLGKSTLIKNIQHRFGFYQVIHFGKPEILISIRSKRVAQATTATSRTTGEQLYQEGQLQEHVQADVVTYYGNARHL